MKKLFSILAATAIATVVTTNSVQAQTSSAAKGSLWGTGLGAVAGGLIGGNVAGAAAGAGIGAGLGYIIGNEDDKKAAAEQAAREREARENAHISADPNTAYQAPATNPFVGTSWRVISLVSEESYPDYSDMVVTFATNSKLTTLAVHKDGTTESWVDSYRVVDNVLVVSGTEAKTGEPYIINAEYSIEGDQLIVVAPNLRVVLENIEARSEG